MPGGEAGLRSLDVPERRVPGRLGPAHGRPRRVAARRPGASGALPDLGQNVEAARVRVAGLPVRSGDRAGSPTPEALHVLDLEFVNQVSKR